MERKLYLFYCPLSMTFPNKVLPLQIHKTSTHYRLLNSQPIPFKICVIYP